MPSLEKLNKQVQGSRFKEQGSSAKIQDIRKTLSFDCLVLAHSWCDGQGHPRTRHRGVLAGGYWSGLFADAVAAVGFGIAAMVGKVGGNGIDLGVEAVESGVVTLKPGYDAVEPDFDAFEPSFNPTEALVQPLLTFDEQIELVLDIFGKGTYAAGEEFIDLLQELFVHGGPPRELS